jgi:hypothetical protein
MIRCRSAGRLRGFIRSRILLARWQPRALPAAGSDAVADGELARLVGPDMLAPMNEALGHADGEARRIGGCARDAYTMLYLCAGLAVLFAACGVAATDNHTLLNVLVLAELATLLVLLLTFRKAHRVNWHGRWLALRFHVEFLRCLPMGARQNTRPDCAPSAQACTSDCTRAACNSRRSMRRWHWRMRARWPASSCATTACARSRNRPSCIACTRCRSAHSA